MWLTIFNSVTTVLAIVLPLLALPLGFAVGFIFKHRLVNNKLGDTQKLADRIVEDAKLEAKSLKKESIEEILKLKTDLEEKHDKEKNEFEKELKERRAELQRVEQRIIQKEEILDRKEQSLDKKIENNEQTKIQLKQKETELDAMNEEVLKLKQSVTVELERVASLTAEQAKQQLIEGFVNDAKRDAAYTVREIESSAKEDGAKKAREIVASAIQRCAADHAAEMTVSVVPLPNDDMKGRIIGREGRNIRALESATGIDLIIDDTPEAVILSGFDPVRREVARITLEKLISDGRIHPARIEEMVEKTKREVDVAIKEAGESAMYEAGVFGINNELIKLLGKLKFRTSYGQNVLKHSIEVSLLAGLMAAELGADVNICKRAGLLHDIGKALDHEIEGTHISIGVDYAKKYKENKDIIHCIAAHHNDIEPETLEAVLVQAADAISGGRPGARRESLENYVKRLEKLENIANSFDGVEKSFAIQAGREVRIVVKPEFVDDAMTIFMAKEIAKKIESELDYPGQIKVNVIREMRSIEYAK